VAACSQPPPLGPRSCSAQGFFDLPTRGQLDVLFVIDDSPGMAPVQPNLAASLPVFMNILANCGWEGTPDLRVGVVTGSGGGTLVDAPQSSDPVCQSARILDGRPFLETIGRGTVNNFAGSLADAFRCLALVGTSGSPFQAPLASARAALATPGFLRDQAYLALIWITNQDDCSRPPGTQPFASTFECAQQGILCNRQPPPSTPTGPLAGCVSNETSSDIVPVRSYIDFLAHLKPLPGHIFTSLVAAPAEPFAVTLDAQGKPELAQSCSPPGGQPAVRLKQLIGGFGNLGAYTTICQDSYATALGPICQCIAAGLTRPLCVGVGPLPQLPNGAVIDPTRVDCTVELTRGQTSLGTMLACSPTGQPSGVCWALIANSLCQSGVSALLCQNGFDPASVDKPCRDGPYELPDTVARIECATMCP